MSENKVFRKVSLERLSSPEELDQRLTVTSPIGWVACVAVALLILAGIIWGVFGSIADKAMGQGIILSSGGITNVIHHANGQIADIRVQEGDYVEKGDVLARIEQTELIDEINKLKENLDVMRHLDPQNPQIDSSMMNLNVYGQIVELARDIEYARTSLDVQKANLNTTEKDRSIRLEQAKLELEQAELQWDENRDRFEKYKQLYAAGAVSEQDFKNAERNFVLSESNLQNKKRSLQNLEEEANILPRTQVLQAEKNLGVLVQQFKDTRLLIEQDLEKQIAMLQMDLFNNSEIIADISGRVVELQVKKGDLLNAGNSVCSIARDDGGVGTLEAVVYVPVAKGKKVMPGMEVNVCPSTVKKEEDGFMLGNVVSVSEYPASAQGMMLTLGNSELVQLLSGQGSPIEVRVELIKDNSTVSGYRWSTPDGPEMIIDGGTICMGEVKVSQQRPISMVVPFIKRILPI